MKLEIIILGLLIIQKCTIYEMRKRIETYFTSMSSNSMGSIQAAVKKLLDGGMIIYSEFVENSVNKKVYEITAKGNTLFIDSVSQPMRYKEKNMELGKLFFMGFAPGNMRIGLINAYIGELNEEKAKLEGIRASTQDSDAAIEHYMNYLKVSGEAEKFAEMIHSESLAESLRDIALFQYAALDLAIAKIDFEIRWFEQFKKQIEE